LVALRALLPTPGSLAAAATLSQIHGKIVAIHPEYREILVHHDPFPAMPMAMTMICTVKRVAQLKGLRPGETIYAQVDTSQSPWVISEIRVQTTASK
jgi:Cu/Ag efflux protein CusF